MYLGPVSSLVGGYEVGQVERVHSNLRPTSETYLHDAMN